MRRWSFLPIFPLTKGISVSVYKEKIPKNGYVVMTGVFATLHHHKGLLQ